jgi:hypothetical protein
LIAPGVVLPSSLSLLGFVALLNQERLLSFVLNIDVDCVELVFTLLAFLTLFILLQLPCDWSASSKT